MNSDFLFYCNLIETEEIQKEADDIVEQCEEEQLIVVISKMFYSNTRRNNGCRNN